MDVRALFGLSVLMSFLAFGIVTKLYIWPQVRVMRPEDALIALVVVHMFRFVGLSFLVLGVVGPSLPSAFARPAAYGDLVAAILAVVATLALSAHTSWVLPIVWIFNVWGEAICCTQFTRARSASALARGRSAPRFSSRQSLYHRYSLHTD